MSFRDGNCRLLVFDYSLGDIDRFFFGICGVIERDGLGLVLIPKQRSNYESRCDGFALRDAPVGTL